MAMQALHRNLRVPTAAVDDFNTNRKSNCLMNVYAVLEQESRLPRLHIPYPPTTHISYTFYKGRELNTEIDYILLSNVLTLLSHVVVPGPAYHRCLVWDPHFPNGLFRVSAFKR